MTELTLTIKQLHDMAACKSAIHAAESITRDKTAKIPWLKLAEISSAQNILWFLRRVELTAKQKYDLRCFARNQALSVIHLWKPEPVVVEYLKTGNENIRKEVRKSADAASDAAAYAASDAAAYAAYAASDAAAYAAYAASDASDAAAYAAATTRKQQKEGLLVMIDGWSK